MFLLFLLLLLTFWYLLMVAYSWLLLIYRKYKKTDTLVEQNSWLEAIGLLIIQASFIKQCICYVFDIVDNNMKQKEEQQKKQTALENVANHLDIKLFDDLNIKTTAPTSVNEEGIIVYLTNSLNNNEQHQLENYFIGVLSKYTAEYQLDVLFVEALAGAGWVAKFYVKASNEAKYNRMARASDIAEIEEFEEVSLWDE
ncbi:TPA: hypothetical protein U1W10_000430 [Streptococcus suis]|nr:hypothetical protein [Streptococcus suis]HEM4050459.1 hypothetical protein [Streptococcus suis]